MLDSQLAAWNLGKLQISIQEIPLSQVNKHFQYKLVIMVASGGGEKQACDFSVVIWNPKLASKMENTLSIAIKAELSCFLVIITGNLQWSFFLMVNSKMAYTRKLSSVKTL